MHELESQGFEVTYLQPDKEGRISLDALKAALRKDTILVSIMMVNNETGAVMPIAQMTKLTHRICPDAVFHTDAVQGFLKIPFQAKTLGADLISVSAHKVHGAKGAGALYICPRLKSFPPLLHGGGQHRQKGHCSAVPAALCSEACSLPGPGHPPAVRQCLPSG
jgi:cysteine desulfurase